MCINIFFLILCAINRFQTYKETDIFITKKPVFPKNIDSMFVTRVTGSPSNKKAACNISEFINIVVSIFLVPTAHDKSVEAIIPCAQVITCKMSAVRPAFINYYFLPCFLSVLGL